MALKPIYLEPDEEITSVIDKISALGDHQVAVVVPKNSSLFQSLINVKLLAKEAKDHHKEIVLITANKVGQRLASEVGLKTYNTLGAVGTTLKAQDIAKEEQPVAEESDETVDGVKVNRYRPPAEGEKVAEGLVAASAVAETAKIAEAAAGGAVVGADVEKEESVPVADFTTVDLDSGKPIEATSEQPKNAKDDLSKTPEAGKPVVAPPDDLPKESKDPEELPAIISRSGSYKEHKEFRIPWLPLGVALGIIIIICIVGLLFVPRATVLATFPAKTINQTLTLDVTTSGNNQDLTITGTKITSDKTVTETINSSGTKDVGTPAGGTVTITNEYRNSSGAGQDETLPAGTVIKDTNSGQTFTLNNAVTIGKVTYNSGDGQPIYQSQTDTVTAASPGSAGNIAASTFSCSTALSNTVIQSSSAFTGGVSNVVKVLTQTDIDNAMNDLKTQATNQTTADLKSQAGKNVLLGGSTWQINQKQSVDHNVGDQTDTALATYELNVGAIVFDPTAALNAIKGDLSSNLGANQELVLNSSNVTNTFSSLNDSQTDMTVSSAVEAFSVSTVGQSTILHAIAGKSSSAAISTIEKNYGASKVVVSFKPPWWPSRLPLLTRFITFKDNFIQAQ